LAHGGRRCPKSSQKPTPPMRLAQLARRNSLTFETGVQRRDTGGGGEGSDRTCVRGRHPCPRACGHGSFPFRVRDGSPQGRDPQGARSERSGDDSPVPARLGRETLTPFFPLVTHRRLFAVARTSSISLRFCFQALAQPWWWRWRHARAVFGGRVTPVKRRMT
jgi:hypothetical protein